MIIRRHTYLPALFQILVFGVVTCASSHGQDQDGERPRLIPKIEPKEKKVELKILGVSDNIQDNIRDVLGERLGFLLTPPASRAAASDMAFILENYMRNEGYPDVEIFWRLESPERIRLRIETGVSATIEEINISGIEGIDQNEQALREELKDILLAKTEARQDLIDEGMPYVPDDLEQGINNIKTLLQARGYWNAEVAMTARQQPETGKTSINVSVEPGNLIQIGTIDFEGLNDSELEMVRPLADSLKGKNATADRLIDFEQRIRAIFDRQGFYNTTVRFSQTTGAKNMALTVDVHPGRQVTVADIIVKDTGRTDEEVIKRRLEPFQGELYDPDTIDEAVQKLYKTGVFERIEVEEIVEPDDTVDLEVSLTEAKAKTIGFYAGLSSESGAIAGVSFDHINVGGRLHQFQSILEYSELGPRGEVKYSIPWFLIDETTATFRLFAISRDYAAYDKFQYGWEHTLGYPFTDHYSVGLRIGGSFVDTRGLQIDPELAGRLDYYVSYIGITQTYDNLNDPINPRDGLVASLQLDTAGSWTGSDISFSRAVARGAYYLPIGESSHFRFAAASGVIHTSDDTLPIDMRFFHGGTNSVRSFRERRGPPFADSGKPIGGNAFNYGSIEFVGPIVGPVKFVVFSDAGNVVQGTDPFNFNDLEVAVGAGIRVNLPTGPIRFEYGYNATHDKGEPEGTFQFVIGATF